MSAPDDTEVTPALWSAVAKRAPATEIPQMLAEVADQMTQETLCWALSQAWTECLDPATVLPRDDWLALWRTAGFTEDGRPARRPGGPMRLWRGALPEFKRGMSWTTCRAAAEVFCWMETGPDGMRTDYTGPPIMLPGKIRITAPRQRRQSTRKRVYEVLAPPGALLGKSRLFGGGPKTPKEYIIDPSGLKIENSPGSQRQR